MNAYDNVLCAFLTAMVVFFEMFVILTLNYNDEIHRSLLIGAFIVFEILAIIVLIYNEGEEEFVPMDVETDIETQYHRIQ
jgi:uncharacterized membrane protein